MFTLLNALDSRVKLVEKFLSIPEADKDYWQREQDRATAMRLRLREMVLPAADACIAQVCRSHGGVD